MIKSHYLRRFFKMTFSIPAHGEPVEPYERSYPSTSSGRAVFKICLTELLLLVILSTPATAKTTMPSLERIHRHIDNKTQASDGTIDFKDAITVTSGKGFVRARDGATLSAATPQIPPLFWATQTELVHKLKQQAATSKNAAIIELRNALIAHYLDDPSPLLAFISDLDSEGRRLEAHIGQAENAKLIETWEMLVITVNNLLLW